MPDPEIAFAYRRDLYAHFGMTLPSGPSPATMKVLFFLRPKTVGRAFDTLDDMVDIVKSYGIPYT